MNVSQGPVVRKAEAGNRTLVTIRGFACPECWGLTFHRDGCSQDDGRPRPEARR